MSSTCESDGTGELFHMCAEIALRGKRHRQVWEYMSESDGIYIYAIFSRGPWLVTVRHDYQLVLHKVVDKDVLVYVPGPGWERIIKELYVYLVLREMEVDGCVIDL